MTFPFDCAPESGVKRYQRYRAEGRTLGESLRNGVSYLRKYLFKKPGAPAAVLEYFQRQRQIVRHLLVGPGDDGVALAAVGDLMWLRNGWDSFLSPAVLDHLNRHDVVLGNLETPLSRLHPVPSFWFDYFTYNSDPQLVKSFRRPDGRNTFTALSTTNNHILDRGDDGMLDTLGLLDELGIRHSGVRRTADECPYVTFTVNGIKFGMLACGWGLNNADLLRQTRLTISWLSGLAPDVRSDVDLTALRRALAAMKAEGVDFRMVFMHWGYEFEMYPSPGLMGVGRNLIAAGADAIFGAHPHVVQPLEVLFVNGYERGTGLDPALTSGACVEDGTGRARKGLIAYSLGNFTTAMWTEACKVGLISGLNVRRQESGVIDWHLRGLDLVYNAQFDPETKGRRLVLLDQWLKLHSRPSLQKTAASTAWHLAG